MQTTADALIKWLLDESPDSLMSFTGAEDGFNERADVVQAADGTDLNDFWNEVQDTIRIRNTDRSSIIDALTFRVTGVSEEVQVPSEVDFEEASEYGQPVGIRAGATRLFRGYDFKFYDLAVRYTWMFIAEADRQQLQQHHNLALEADIKLQFRKVMQCLFNPINGNGFTDKNEAVTVYRFYNGDGEVPPKYKQNTFLSTHNHYVVNGNASVRPQDLETLADLTEEHGYTLQNGYTTVLWVNKQEADIIKGFKAGTNSAKFDFVPNPAYYGGKVWVPNNGSYVGGPTGTVKGEIGTYGPFHVVEEGYIPAGYMASIVTGGQNNISNPIGLREHKNPAYRGLKVIPGQRSDYPLIDSFYRRGVGTGIRHRGAGAIMQIKASGTYSVPSAYDPANG
jgi:hypothetical protein